MAMKNNNRKNDKVRDSPPDKGELERVLLGINASLRQAQTERSEYFIAPDLGSIIGIACFTRCVESVGIGGG